MQWISVLVLAAAAGALGLKWKDIPDRWPTHWGIGGRPDAWAVRGFWSVYWPLIVGAAIWLALEFAATLAQRNASDARASKRILVVLRISELAPTTILSATSLWLPLGVPTSPVPLVVFSLIVVLFAVVFAARATGGSDGELHRKGLLHHDPSDDRLWIPAKLGWALNFGHPEARRLMAVLMLPPLFILLTVIFCVLAARRR